MNVAAIAKTTPRAKVQLQRCRNLTEGRGSPGGRAMKGGSRLEPRCRSGLCDAHRFRSYPTGLDSAAGVGAWGAPTQTVHIHWGSGGVSVNCSLE